jgi:hypothetical protein
MQKIIGFTKRFGSRTRRCQWSQIIHSRYPGVDTQEQDPDGPVELRGWDGQPRL